MTTICNAVGVNESGDTCLAPKPLLVGIAVASCIASAAMLWATTLLFPQLPNCLLVSKKHMTA